MIWDGNGLKLCWNFKMDERKDLLIEALQRIGVLSEHSNVKVEKNLEGSLDSIQSPSPSVKIQILGGKVCFRCKGKPLLGDVNKLFVYKSLLATPSNGLPFHLKQIFLPMIWIFTEGDGIKSKLPLKKILLHCLEFRVGHFRHWSHSMAIVTFNKIVKYEHRIMVYYILT